MLDAPIQKEFERLVDDPKSVDKVQLFTEVIRILKKNSDTDVLEEIQMSSRHSECKYHEEKIKELEEELQK